MGKDDKQTQNNTPENSRNDGTDKEKAELLRVIKEKDEKIKNLEAIKSKNTDDIAPGILKQNTFGGSYKNGYEDGTVEAAIIKAKQNNSLVAHIEH